MDNEENKDQANEPATDYNKRLVFFNSFQEAEDDDNKWLAYLTPEQHLQNAVQLIKRLYSDELKTGNDIGTDLKII